MSSSAIRNTYSKIINKDNVGKVKAPLYELPSSEYSYGKAAGNDKEGVRALTSSWQTHTPTRTSIPKKDFKNLNKLSINSGLSSSKHFRDFTQINDGVRVVPKTGTKAVQIVLPEEEFRYGINNRPSTPMNQVMSNNYGNNAAAFTEDIYHGRIAESSETRSYRPKTTKTVQLGLETTAKKLEEMDNYGNSNEFKMKQFQKAQRKVETFNSEYVPASYKTRPQTAKNYPHALRSKQI